MEKQEQNIQATIFEIIYYFQNHIKIIQSVIHHHNILPNQLHTNNFQLHF